MKNFISSIQGFFKLESAGGIAIIIAVALALATANTPLHEAYEHLIHSEFKLSFLGLSIDETFHFFVNDGLLSIFFFLVALELKRELKVGELSDPKNLILPALSAIGGVIVPIGIYFYFNQGTPTENGWATPGATDIAIAFGVLMLLGNRVPNSLKVFLLSLAIIDDIIIIGVIALFFSGDVNTTYLVYAGIATLALIALNIFNISNFAPFAIVGAVLWFFMYQSGLHATLAGVILGLTIPMTERFRYNDNGEPVEKRKSMLESIEHSLHETVNFGILPLFAFINAGVAIHMSDFTTLTSPVSLGIILGLFLGKQVGVFVFSFLTIKLKLAPMPRGANFLQMWGIAILCGVGFTMGLFIGELSFAGMDVSYKLSILVGSTLSALTGLAVMKVATRNTK